MKRLISIILAFIILTSITSCTALKEQFDYPDYFTAQYCYENYFPMSLNYKYAHSYKKTTDYHFFGEGLSRKFSAIPDTEINNFIACQEKFGLGGSFALYYPILYQAKDSDIDPLNDWTIDNVEICLQKEDVCFSTNEKNIASYGDYLYHTSISKTTNDILVKQLVDCIKKEDKYIRYYDNDLNIFGENVRFNEEDSSYLYAIRIHFKETNMIFWTASIIIHDEHYYLMCRKRIQDYEYCIPLTEELEEFISSNVNPI